MNQGVTPKKTAESQIYIYIFNYIYKYIYICTWTRRCILYDKYLYIVRLQCVYIYILKYWHIYIYVHDTWLKLPSIHPAAWLGNFPFRRGLACLLVGRTCSSQRGDGHWKCSRSTDVDVLAAGSGGSLAFGRLKGNYIPKPTGNR